MTRLQRYILTLTTVALVLFVALGVAMLGSQMATAAPAQQELPAQMVTGGFRPISVNMLGSRVVTANVLYGDAFDVTSYDEAEIQVVVDQTLVNTLPNTVTVYMQSSMDRINWTSDVLTTSVADMNAWFTPSTVTGRYGRVMVSPAATIPVTVSVAGVLEP